MKLVDFLYFFYGVEKVKSPCFTLVARNSYLTNKPDADGSLISRSGGRALSNCANHSSASVEKRTKGSTK